MASTVPSKFTHECLNADNWHGGAMITRLQNSFKHLLQGHDRNRICGHGLDMDVRRGRLRGSGRPFFGPNINRN